MKIIVLSENTTKNSKVTPEFGLSLYIECGTKRILFDSGMSDNFARNAEKLGIDLSQIDIAVLSHGHYDHADGFKTFLELNDHAPIYAHAGYDGNYYNAAHNYIGIANELKGNNRFISVNDRCELGEGITLLSYSGTQSLHPVNSSGLLRDSDGELLPDDFSHEHYLLAHEGDTRLLVTGCGHKGIANIMNWTRSEKVTHVVGGFHLVGTKPENFGSLNSLAQELLSYGVDYRTCHCTGIEQYAYLKARMGDKISYLSTGQIAEF